MYGKLISYRGWKLKGGRKEKIRIQYLGKPFKLISPDGIVIEGRNAKDFASKNGMHQQNLQALIAGKLKTCKGWRSIPCT